MTVKEQKVDPLRMDYFKILIGLVDNSVIKVKDIEKSIDLKRDLARVAGISVAKATRKSPGK